VYFATTEDYLKGSRKFLSYLEDEWPHLLVSGLYTLITKNPALGLAFHAGLHTEGIFLGSQGNADSGGLGAPAGSTPTAPSISSQSSREGRESSEPAKHGVSRQSSQRRDRGRRKSCPKGHYWSYKEKKCVKSKFS